LGCFAVRGEKKAHVEKGVALRRIALELWEERKEDHKRSLENLHITYLGKKGVFFFFSSAKGRTNEEGGT